MIHDADVNDPRDEAEEIEVLVELMKVGDQGGHAEAGEDDWRLLEDLAKLVVEGPLVVLGGQAHEVDDVGLVSSTESEQRGTEDIDLEVFIEHVGIHLYVDTHDLV